MAETTGAMGTLHFLRSTIELASIQSLDALLDEALRLLERELGQRARIELWDDDGTRIVRGDAALEQGHCTWIGIHYTLGAIQLPASPSDSEAVVLLAGQLALIGERLFAVMPRRTMREEIECAYQRRIRDALIRHDWNASAVARELRVSRGRVAKVALQWRKR